MAAIEGLAPVGTDDWGLVVYGPLRCARNGLGPVPFSEGYRKHLAPTIAAVRSALLVEHIERRYSGGALTDLPSAKRGLVEVGFRLEVGAALEGGDLRAAIELLVDLWRFDHDIERLDGSAPLRFVSVERVAAGVIARLDSASLAQLHRDLARLEETAPVYADRVRDRRLRAGAALGADLRGENPWHLDHSSSLGRALFMKRYVELPLREAHWREKVTRHNPTWIAWPEIQNAPETFQGPIEARIDSLLSRIANPGSISYSLARDDFASFLDDLVALRAARLLCAVRRYALEHGGVSPSSFDEALGRACGEHERDPYDGAQLRFRTGERAFTVYSVGQNLKDDGGTLEPTDYVKGPPDVGLSVPR